MRNSLIAPILALGLALVSAPSLAATQTADIPAAIWRDPPADAAHPARMVTLHIPSGGVEINGVAYLAAGAGPHPTVIVCHGLPGNEKNLDLAQALRRQGWNAITFNYRGSWGSPGAFHFVQNPQDLHAVLTYLRSAAQAKALTIDVTRLAVVGHSMGGWVTAMDGGDEPGVVALGLFSAANMGEVGTLPYADLVRFMHENDETLAGTSVSELADELGQHSAAFNFETKAQSLTHVPMLVLTANDGLAGMSDALVAAVRKAGGNHVELAHVATDHSWSDRRIDLETRIIRFLQPHFA
jgi:pimeloyl-ACP methyl ester carboxylesterase